METLRLALSQSKPVEGDTDAGLHLLDGVAQRAREQNADVLITPEMALTGYNVGVERIRQLAEPLNGRLIEAVSEIALENRISILTGFAERGADGNIYNAIVWVDESGERIAVYRKTHLYGDVDRRQFSAGNILPEIVAFRGWNCGLGICYDVEFPEFSRHQALNGADLLLVPTANMLPFISVATRIVPARAEENALYLAYANYCGSEGEFDYCGLSCVCGPDGNDIVRAGDQEVLMIAEISKSHLAKTRKTLTYLSDRRSDLYGP